ncbi:MAG: GNAT family N-acetyltransferase [Candidatus Thorarchaeota archaeon]
MEEIVVRLGNNREIILRRLRPDDKRLLLDMFANMSEDALLWSNPPYDEEKIDRWIGSSENGISIVAISKDRLVGIAAVYQLLRQRQNGIGGMMIYLHQDFHGIGLGTEMTDQLLSFARDKGLHRIGLEVVEENEAAVRLYQKCGFEIEGVMRDAYFGTDNKYHNLLVMGMLFSDNLK